MILCAYLAVLLCAGEMVTSGWRVVVRCCVQFNRIDVVVCLRVSARSRAIGGRRAQARRWRMRTWSASATTLAVCAAARLSLFGASIGKPDLAVLVDIRRMID